ncbi:rRNA biogenesis protein rrp36 [Aspergillus nanangensis]|uniref:rRNA biogenesis protein RRP36 n=1 Tax=Aspergillus nanangensis TaxID=2582783 RepID=A0AAD4CDA6_ASPNN|nr:rRNA biogenesis protein rrp36 [Aspergillus nanangensis]
MAISDLLNRRVRALPDEDDEAYSDASGSSQNSHGEQAEGSESDSDDVSNGSLPDTDESADESDDLEADDDQLDEEEDSEEDDDHPDDDVQASLSSISFGALAKAQASLGPKNKRKSKSTETPTTASPLDDIRARILEAREQKRQLSSKPSDDNKPARSSKHAPMAQSSKRAVTRRRTIIEPPAVPKARDPRFDPTVMSNSHRNNPAAANKAYSFLDDYRVSELKELKAKFAKTKNPDEKEELKRNIRSTSDRLRAMEHQKREQGILAEHKKREKQLIREGKKSNPYYMKKSDLKKEVLLKKYEGMNSKDRMKALERRRKKVASKERKEMPMERRGFEGDDSTFNESGGGGGGGKRRRIA